MPDIESSFGGAALRKITSQLYPSVYHCWVDNFCILQDDEEDKFEQIPLMADIYGRAETVAVIHRTHFGFSQSQVEYMMGELDEVFKTSLERSWKQTWFQKKWYDGPNFELVKQAMFALKRLTISAWGTRVWTLQEYLLAQNVVWIGTDFEPLSYDYKLFLNAVSGIYPASKFDPELTDIGIWTLLTDFRFMFTYCAGRSKHDTRMMDLARHRDTTIPADKIYGIMAASGVKIAPIHAESLEDAWKRWWTAALHQGHIRWALLPPRRFGDEPQYTQNHCLMPQESGRCGVSLNSGLSNIVPLSAVDINDGTVTMSGYFVGHLNLLREMGMKFSPRKFIFDPIVDYILLTHGRWRDAIQMFEALAELVPRFEDRVLVAQTTVDNYPRALSFAFSEQRGSFSLYFRTELHSTAWDNHMPTKDLGMDLAALHSGTFFLAEIIYSNVDPPISTIAILGDYLPTNPLVVLGFDSFILNKRSNRQTLLIAEIPPNGSSLHKLGMTTAIHSDRLPMCIPANLQEFRLGGSSCQICSQSQQDRPRTKGQVRRRAPETRYFIPPEKAGAWLRKERVERKIRFKNIRRSLDLRGLNRSRRRSLFLRPKY